MVMLTPRIPLCTNTIMHVYNQQYFDNVLRCSSVLRMSLQLSRSVNQIQPGGVLNYIAITRPTLYRKDFRRHHMTDCSWNNNNTV